MSKISAEVNTLEKLIEKLVSEHRKFTYQTKELNQIIQSEHPVFEQMTQVFSALKEDLAEHMLIEETEIFPEVSNRGLFTERISEIMQQHLDITAALDKMKFGLRGRNPEDLRNGFNELLRVMMLHFPAEESEVFSLVS